MNSGENMNDLKKSKIAVLMGGYSAEREVSLRSGRAAAEALRSLGCDAVEVDVKHDRFELPQETKVAFLALHGTGGEDGVVQAVLESKGVVYTGSDSRASRLAFNKVESKGIFRKAGLETPRDWVVARSDLSRLRSPPDLRFPRVVKPASQGSSIGVRMVEREADMEAAIVEAMQKDSVVLVEEFIPGRELTVGILLEKTLPVIEIRPKSGWYDYTNKYTKNATEYLVPAPISDSLAKHVQKEALEAHRVLGCRDLSRSDFRVDDTGKAFLLEVNTLPGMTETSLFPKAAATAGIDFPHLCLALVKNALNRVEKP